MPSIRLLHKKGEAISMQSLGYTRRNPGTAHKKLISGCLRWVGRKWPRWLGTGLREYFTIKTSYTSRSFNHVYIYICNIYIILKFFMFPPMALGIIPRDWCMLGKPSACELHTQPIKFLMKPKDWKGTSPKESCKLMNVYRKSIILACIWFTCLHLVSC